MEKINTSGLPDIEILYEDNHLIAVCKPAGMLVQGDDTKDESLFDRTQQFIKIKYQKPGNVYLGLIHRLDRPASGVVLFAKTSKAASRLSDQFRRHTTEKSYKIIVHNSPEKKTGVLKDYVMPVSGKKNIMQITSNKNIGKSCELSYEVISCKKGYSEVNVQLKTGRKHQIRVQFANIGCPVAGDLKYGSSLKVADGRAICLHAESLKVEHPTKKESILITSPLPEYWF